VPLAEDLSKLFYRTNCTVNRKVIVNEWKEVARMAEYAPLVENVQTIAESKNFEDDYEAFLRHVFLEDMTTKVAKAKMYLNALKDMKNVLANSDADEELTESLEEYIVRLEQAGDEVDDATLMEVEELVASTSENLMRDVNSLADFDTIPEVTPEEPDEFGMADLGAEEGAAAGGLAEGGAPAGGLELPFGGEEEEGEEEAGAALPPEEEEAIEKAFESAGRTGDVISEKFSKCEKCGKPSFSCKCEGSDACPTCKKPTSGEGSVCECGPKEEKVREAAAKLDESLLRTELKEWQKKGEEFYAADGYPLATIKMRALRDRAKSLKLEDVADAFSQILAENTPVDVIDVETSTDPYLYDAQDGLKIDRDYGQIDENLSQMRTGVKEHKPGGQMGGGSVPSDEAMGSAECPTDMNVDKKHGYPEATLKGGKSSNPCESVRCPDCKQGTDLAEAMTNDGAVCAHCGADVTKQMMEALELCEEISGAGHQMDRVGDGSGVTGTGMTTSDGKGAGGSKEKMDQVAGDGGVAGRGMTSSDGRSAHGGKGSKEEMDDQGGTEICCPGCKSHGKVKGLTEDAEGVWVCSECGREMSAEEIEENQYHPPTRRKGYNYPPKGRATRAQTESKKTVSEATVSVSGPDEESGLEKTVSYEVEDEDVDSLVSRIASSISELPDEGLEGEDLSELGEEAEEFEEEEFEEEGEGLEGEELEGEGLEGEGLEGEELEGEELEGEELEGEEFEEEGEELEGEGEELDVGEEEEVGGPEGLAGAEGEEDLEGEGLPPEGGEGEMPPPEEGEEGIPPPPPGEEEEEIEEAMSPEFKKNIGKFGKGKGKKGGKKGPPEFVKKGNGDDEGKGEAEECLGEDNDVTQPTAKGYANETAARQDGDGGSLTKKPTFGQKDYDGTGGKVKTARGG
jgi:hypothetical protein